MIKLTEFDLPVLRSMLSAIQLRRIDLEKHNKEYEKFPDIARMMLHEISMNGQQIAFLTMAEVQVATAIVMVRDRETVKQN
jgi:hypothetical protein